MAGVADMPSFAWRRRPGKRLEQAASDTKNKGGNKGTLKSVLGRRQLFIASCVDG